LTSSSGWRTVWKVFGACGLAFTLFVLLIPTTHQDKFKKNYCCTFLNRKKKNYPKYQIIVRTF